MMRRVHPARPPARAARRNGRRSGGADLPAADQHQTRGRDQQSAQQDGDVDRADHRHRSVMSRDSRTCWSADDGRPGGDLGLIGAPRQVREDCALRRSSNGSARTVPSGKVMTASRPVAVAQQRVVAGDGQVVELADTVTSGVVAGVNVCRPASTTLRRRPRRTAKNRRRSGCRRRSRGRRPVLPSSQVVPVGAIVTMRPGVAAGGGRRNQSGIHRLAVLVDETGSDRCCTVKAAVMRESARSDGRPTGVNAWSGSRWPDPSGEGVPLVRWSPALVSSRVRVCASEVALLGDGRDARLVGDHRGAVQAQPNSGQRRRRSDRQGCPSAVRRIADAVITPGALHRASGDAAGVCTAGSVARQLMRRASAAGGGQPAITASDGGDQGASAGSVAACSSRGAPDDGPSGADRGTGTVNLRRSTAAPPP